MCSLLSLSSVGESSLDTVFSCGKRFVWRRLRSHAAAVARIARNETVSSAIAALEDVEAKGPKRLVLIDLDAISGMARFKVPSADNS
jgi:hypothetical protein